MGQDGNPFSAWYDNTLGLWQTGDMWRMATTGYTARWLEPRGSSPLGVNVHHGTVHLFTCSDSGMSSPADLTAHLTGLERG